MYMDNNSATVLEFVQTILEYHRKTLNECIIFCRFNNYHQKHLFGTILFMLQIVIAQQENRGLYTQGGALTTRGLYLSSPSCP